MLPPASWATTEYCDLSLLPSMFFANIVTRFRPSLLKPRESKTEVGWRMKLTESKISASVESSTVSNSGFNFITKLELASAKRSSCELSDGKKRSEEHTSELQSHSFISYAVFCLKK